VETDEDDCASSIRCVALGHAEYGLQA
jgi:hypothetical protein